MTGAKEKMGEKKPRGGNVDLVYSTLRDDILELRRAPGEVLDEAEIAATFGLSRSPVREAIVRLTAERLAEALKNRGAVVSRLDIEMLPAYFDAQKLLFRLTSRLAAQHGGAFAAARLSQIQDRHESIVAARDADGVIMSNRQFHLEIAALGRNRYYQEWLSGILDQGQRIMRLYVRSHDEAVPIDQLSYHHALIDAIARKDVEAADLAAAADAQIVRDEISRQISAGSSLLMPL